MQYLGIDPGKHGGIAAIYPSQIVAVPMPETELDIFNLIYKLASPGPAVVVVEHVTTSPQMGVVSAGTFMANYYGIRMALIALQKMEKVLQYDCVRPQVWQKSLMVPPKKKKTETKDEWKNRLRTIAQRLFPQFPLWIEPKSKGKQMAVADAMLIAEYCKRTYQRERSNG